MRTWSIILNVDGHHHSVGQSCRRRRTGILSPPSGSLPHQYPLAFPASRMACRWWQHCPECWQVLTISQHLPTGSLGMASAYDRSSGCMDDTEDAARTGRTALSFIFLRTNCTARLTTWGKHLKLMIINFYHLPQINHGVHSAHLRRFEVPVWSNGIPPSSSSISSSTMNISLFDALSIIIWPN